MNKEIKEKWIKALRSGAYFQGKHKLHRIDPEGDRYCCLGVLCDLAAKENIVERIDTGHGYYKYGINPGSFSYGDTSIALSEDIKAWAEIDHAEGAFNDGEERKLLSLLNDEEELSFDEIADVIEEHF